MMPLFHGTFRFSYVSLLSKKRSTSPRIASFMSWSKITSSQLALATLSHSCADFSQRPPSNTHTSPCSSFAHLPAASSRRSVASAEGESTYWFVTLGYALPPSRPSATKTTYSLPCQSSRNLPNLTCSASAPSSPSSRVAGGEKTLQRRRSGSLSMAARPPLPALAKVRRLQED